MRVRGALCVAIPAWLTSIACAGRLPRASLNPLRPLLNLQVTGEPLRARFFGKPHAEPYRLAEGLLVQQARALGFEQLTPPAAANESQPLAGDGAGQQPLPFSAIYAVGDNPAADVRGANAAGPPWVSVLVTQTGVARANCSTDPAQASPSRAWRSAHARPTLVPTLPNWHRSNSRPSALSLRCCRAGGGG